MATYLLTWNPKRTSWDDPEDGLEALVEDFHYGERPITDWSCGNTKRIEEGGRVWHLRQGEDPGGLFAWGTVVTPTWEEQHWEDPTKTSQYIEYQMDWIVDPDTDPDQIIPRARLDDPPFNSVHWDTQRSGIHIPDDVASALQQELPRWSRLVQLDLATPDGDVAGSYTISVPAAEEERLRAELATHPEAEYGVLDGYADHLGFDLDTEDWDGWTWRPRQMTENLEANGQEGNELQESGQAQKSQTIEVGKEGSTQFKENQETCFENAPQTVVKPLPVPKAPRTKIAPKQQLPEPTGQGLKALHIAGKATWWMITATVYTLKALLQATWWMIRMMWRVLCKIAWWTFSVTCWAIGIASVLFFFVMWVASKLFDKVIEVGTPKKME